MKARILLFTLLMCNCAHAQENIWTSDVGQGIYESRLRNLDGYFFTIDCGTELSPMGKNASAFLEKRAKQNVEWMKKLLHEMIDARLQKNPALATRLPSLQSDIVAGRVTPYSAARELISFL